MSEHTRVKGNVIYDHMPYQEEGFSYCKRCKKFVDKLEVCFNEGFCSEWMQVNCGECGKCIWVCEFGIKEDGDEVGIRKMVKDDQKCIVCKKPTNHYDCVCYGGRVNSKKTNYWCSKKCYDIDRKKEEKEEMKNNENERVNKITIMLKEFNLDYNLQYPYEIPDLELIMKIIAKNYPKEKSND